MTTAPAALDDFPAALPFPRRLAILGSTGSIGASTLRVVDSLPERFEVVALAAGGNLDKLEAQARRYRPRLLSVRAPEDARELARRLAGLEPRPEILHGPAGLCAAAASSGARMVVAAVVGIAALQAAYDALRAGCWLALANKEILVAGGELVMAAAQRSGAPVLPVDSEHSALHQCLRGGRRGELRRLILTASGGPFRQLPLEHFDRLTPEQALRHPTWTMGERVTLDSATLMNKGFEILEACHLFGVSERQVDVLIHPQSLVHSLVEFRDGSLLAQLGCADMALPVQYALTWPERLEVGRELRLQEWSRLDFHSPDPRRFPCLELARAAGRAGGAAGAALNAADEVALAAFRRGALPFPAIARVIEAVLGRFHAPTPRSIGDILEIDSQVRRLAEDRVAAEIKA